MKVTVYHNVALDHAGRHLGWLDGFRAAHPVTPVFSAEVPDGPDLDVCDEVFRLLNIGDDPSFGQPDPRAQQYRMRGNRSMSVGDLTRIDGRFYACTDDGWQRVWAEPTITREARVPGTTPLRDAG